MFISDPICILTAGVAANGKEISQQIIDEMAESYDPNVYTARIRPEQEQFGNVLGSVTSLEKRGNKLYAVLKPNSKLLRAVEQGQLLHTACEYVQEFAGTGKAYLTGLALTDAPLSLGTTQIHLSSSETNAQALNNDVIEKGIFHKKDDQVSELRSKVTELTTQFENLTKLANKLTGESTEEDDTYL